MGGYGLQRQDECVFYTDTLCSLVLSNRPIKQVSALTNRLPLCSLALLLFLFIELYYTFQITTGPSGIPNGGTGAFIEFLGGGRNPRAFDSSITTVEMDGVCINLGKYGPFSKHGMREPKTLLCLMFCG